MNIPGVGAEVWKTIKGLVADTVGPMALLGIAAQKFVSASAGAALNAQRMAEALKASDGAERLKQQFEQLMGSSTAARRQVEMLAKVASGSAFTFDSLAEASKNLQVLTSGALNSERALKKVQDVAAATGAPVDTMATAVADLYNALKSGDGVEAASGQLKSMGAISAVTAKKLESLSASGVGLAATWQLVEGDLNKANGAASALGGTIAGLQQQLANIQQGSDTKIGEMFAEGEKAGLRAAIGFKKFTSAVEEANAGPWAAFNGAINSVKEAIGGFLGAVAETDTVKNTFNAIATVAVGVLQALYASLIAAIPFFLRLAAAAGGTAVAALTRFAAAAGITSASVARLGNSLKGALFNSFTVGATIATVAASALAAQILKAAQAVGELNQEFQQAGKERVSGMAESSVESATARTPEERDAAEKSIKGRIKQSKDREKVFSDQFDKGAKMLDSWNPFTRMAGETIIGTANQGVRQERDYQSSQQDDLSALYENPMGADQELLKISQERVKLEQQIRDAARDRIQASATPENAAKIAATQKVKAQKELEYAEKATKNKFDDTRNLNSGAQKFQESQTRREDYVAKVEKGISESRTLIEKSVPNSPAGKLYTKSVNKALEEGNFDDLQKFADRGVIDKGALAQYREGLATKRSMGKNRPELDYDAFNTGAVSESGKIEAEIAKRTAMQEEEKKALRDQKQSGGGPSQDVNNVRAKMIGLKNPLTGKSELEGNKEFDDLNAQLSEALKNKDVPRIQEIQGRMGDLASKSMALSDQRLQTDLKTAAEKEDPNAKRTALENADIVDQRAKEAEAADKASNAAGQRKLNVQRQINYLQGMEGGDGKAAEAELGPEIAQLKKKQEAMDKLKKAEDAVVAAEQGGDKSKIAEAQANYNTERVKAMEAGVKGGDTVESINQEVQATQNILQIRKQQAAIEQAAAQRRRDDLMNEIKLSNQINQIRLQRTEGGMGGKGDKDRTKTERDVKLDDLKRKQGDLEKAGAVMAERDAAAEAGNFDLANTKKKELESLGVDANASAGDLSTKLAQNKDEQQNVKVQQVLQRKGYEDDVRIALARTKEDYGVTRDERESGRNERRSAEDEKMKKGLKEDYEKNQGLNAGEAEQMAELETKRQRLLADDAEAGTPRIDSLTAVGGGSTGSVGPVKDIQQEIKKINEEMRSLLETIVSETQSQARMVGQYQDSPNY